MRSFFFGISEVVDTMLPRKSSKLQVKSGRTLNGHTWVG